MKNMIIIILTYTLIELKFNCVIFVNRYWLLVLEAKEAFVRQGCDCNPDSQS